MEIYYYLSDYISHRRAGLAYMACLRQLGHRLVDDPRECQLVILHESPRFYPAFFRTFPRSSGTRYVGYAVWETSQLPESYRQGLALVDEIWTCSGFSRQAFAPHIPCHVLPHVVERPRVSPADLQWMARRLGMESKGKERSTYFYTIVDSVNPRKDLRTLLTAFAAAFPGEEQRVRLVVKQYRKSCDLSAFKHVVDIPEGLSDGQMAALHASCDIYVSAHHTEAWGLPLSEAMSFGKAVIATGWSGNMEFMDAQNSFPVRYSLGNVSEEMCRSLPMFFSPDMIWANVDTVDLIRTLRQVRRQVFSTAWRESVCASMERFGPEAIARRIQTLLSKN